MTSDSSSAHLLHKSSKEESPRLKARIAGLLYVIVIVAGGWAQLFVRSHLVVRNDAAVTAANILAQEPLFRLGLAADLVAAICFVGVVFILYDLLKPAGRSLSLLAAFFGMAGNAIFAINLLNHLAAAVLLDNARVLAAFKPDHLQALALVFLKLHTQGYLIVMVFFGIYLALIGVLIFRSVFLPRILGVLLVAGGLADVAVSFAVFLSPPFADKLPSYVTLPGGVAEILLALWLFAIGVNASKWREQTLLAKG